MEQITLYFKQGTSDKIYQVSLEQQNGGYVVNFAYGRRGSTMNTGTKTQSPVGYNEAKAIYDKLVKEKTAKGYKPGSNGTPYQQTPTVNEDSGIHCQLLNPIDEREASYLVVNPAFAMQEKYDGKRMIIRKYDHAVEGINRNGHIVSLPDTIARDAQKVPVDFTLDGECVGDHFIAFDVLARNGDDIRHQPFKQRHIALLSLTTIPWLDHIHFAETAFDMAAKAAMLERLKKEGKEGVVFKNIHASYTAGRPASGGGNLKLKFYETASFIVSKLNGKRSVGLILFNGEKVVPVGNVTIPPNHDIPKIGNIVEVRYLYAYKGGSIFQPVYLGKRDDIQRVQCVVKQLKFKAEMPEENEAAVLLPC
jgi:bifunctional non-homologous end joining protein LigD